MSQAHKNCIKNTKKRGLWTILTTINACNAPFRARRKTEILTAAFRVSQQINDKTANSPFDDFAFVKENY